MFNQKEFEKFKVNISTNIIVASIVLFLLVEDY